MVFLIALSWVFLKKDYRDSYLLSSLFMSSGSSVILEVPIDVSVVGEKFGGAIEIPFVGDYLVNPEIRNYKEIPDYDNLSKEEKLYEMGGNISLRIEFTCGGKSINLHTQKIYSGVISGFRVPADIPRGTCEYLSIYIEESDPSFSQRRGDLYIEIRRKAK